VEAAQALGARGSRVVISHVFPNLVPLLLVLTTVQFSAAVLAESALAFLGWGVPPPAPSWGQMLSGPARTHLVEHPQLSLWPGVALSLTIFAVNEVADGLRDLLDPRLRRS
jgi:peptide/nickel transport system permease protein